MALRWAAAGMLAAEGRFRSRRWLGASFPQVAAALQGLRPADQPDLLDPAASQPDRTIQQHGRHSPEFPHQRASHLRAWWTNWYQPGFGAGIGIGLWWGGKMRAREADRLYASLEHTFAGLYAVLDGATFEPGPGCVLLVCPPVQLPLFNGMWASGTDDVQAAPCLPASVEMVEGHGFTFWLQTRWGRSPTVEAEAQRLGLQLLWTQPGMACTAGELDAAQVPGLEVERVEDADGLGLALELGALGFEADPGLMAALYAPEVAALPQLTVYIARSDGVPVTTAMGWSADETVGIFGVATPPAYRGHGFGTAVTAHAMREGVAAGADMAWLQASPSGHPVYRAMGFREVETFAIWGRPDPRA